jgi:magnesium-transporting ATPase (P-type)
MSVIVRVLDKENFDMYCKGSPEKIAEMSKPESCKQLIDLKNKNISFLALIIFKYQKIFNKF